MTGRLSFAAKPIRLLLAATFLVWWSYPVAAQVSEADVRASIEREFGVEVLKIDETESDGGQAYVVTVMNPGGDFNSAFMVSRLLVDRQTGRLISQFRHRAAGYDLSGAADNITDENVGVGMRRDSMQAR